uniref:Uncharacterized protein n=1 Tax=Strongyloides stercoralis TaxID=6248 RepID=A0AAF5DLN7_STRER
MTKNYIYDVYSITVTTLAQEEFLTKNENISNDRVQKNLDLWYFVFLNLSKMISYINILKFYTQAVLSIIVKEGKKFIDFKSKNRFTFVTYINDKKCFDDNKERFEQIFDEIKKCYSILLSHNNDFFEKLTAEGLKVFL